MISRGMQASSNVRISNFSLSAIAFLNFVVSRAFEDFNSLSRPSSMSSMMSWSGSLSMRVTKIVLLSPRMNSSVSPIPSGQYCAHLISPFSTHSVRLKIPADSVSHICGKCVFVESQNKWWQRTRVAEGKMRRECKVEHTFGPRSVRMCTTCSMRGSEAGKGGAGRAGTPKYESSC